MLKLLRRHIYNENLLGLKLINASEGVASFTKLRENGADSCNKKQKAALDKIPTAVHSFVEKSKQNHRKLPKFKLTLRLFRAGKQCNRNYATHLETGFPKMLTKNMFSFHSKICFCCHSIVGKPNIPF